MNTLQKSIIPFLLLLAFNNVFAQVDFEDFTTHAAPAIFKLQGSKPIFGLTLGEEWFITEKFNAGLSANAGLSNGNGGSYIFKTYDKYNNNNEILLVPYSKEVNYYSFNLTAAYYLKDYDLAGSNAYIKVGPMFQYLHYTTIDNEMSLLKYDNMREVGFTNEFNLGLTYGAGYVYSFESGFGLYAFAEYDHRLMKLSSNSINVLKNTNSFNFGVGVRFNITTNGAGLSMLRFPF